MRSPAARSLAWIDGQRAEFCLATPSIERVKRLGELAIMASVLEPDGGERMAWAWEQLGGGDAIAALLPIQPTIGCVYIPFRIAGLRSPALEERLVDPTSRRGVRDAHWFIRYAVGVTIETIGVASPWRLTHGDAFVVDRNPLRAELAAHVVMWRTRMGREPYAFGDDDRRQLAAAIPVWSTQLAAAGEWDALAEISIAASCARLPVPDSIWHELRAAQRDDGSLPLYRGAASSFADSYHATLVAIIAWTLAAEAPARHASAERLAGAAYAHFCD